MHTINFVIPQASRYLVKFIFVFITVAELQRLLQKFLTVACIEKSDEKFWIH